KATMPTPKEHPVVDEEFHATRYFLLRISPVSKSVPRRRSVAGDRNASASSSQRDLGTLQPPRTRIVEAEGAASQHFSECRAVLPHADGTDSFPWRTRRALRPTRTGRIGRRYSASGSDTAPVGHSRE